MSTINVTSASQSITVEQLFINKIVLNLNDSSCIITVTGIDNDNSTGYLQGNVFTTNLTLSGIDFSNNINTAGIMSWICTQLGYTQA